MSLVIKNLQARIDRPILTGVNLTVAGGEVAALIGPNGSGKSTLAAALAGRPDVVVERGTARLNKKNLLVLSPEERARLGLFIGWQSPVALSGVSTLMFLKTAFNERRVAEGRSPLPARDIISLIKKQADMLGMSELMLRRSVNEGFSGGEKKLNEILQMLVLSPRMIILDEIDSGLDADALKKIARVINNFRSPQRAWLIISHHFRLLDYLRVDRVHIFQAGKISQTGSVTLAKQAERRGYAGFNK